MDRRVGVLTKALHFPIFQFPDVGERRSERLPGGLERGAVLTKSNDGVALCDELLGYRGVPVPLAAQLHEYIFENRLGPDRQPPVGPAFGFNPMHIGCKFAKDARNISLRECRIKRLDGFGVRHGGPFEWISERRSPGGCPLSPILPVRDYGRYWRASALAFVVACRDPGSSQLHVTHEVLARMLGVRRIVVTHAAIALQKRKLLHYHRREVVTAVLASLASPAAVAAHLAIEVGHPRRIYAPETARTRSGILTLLSC